MSTAYRAYSPERQCDGKRPYTSKQAAKKAAKRNEQIPGADRLYPYRCPHCDLWHLGHKPPAWHWDDESDTR